MPQWVRWLWLTLALLGALYMGGQLIGLLLLVAIALLLTTALVPVVDWLEARGVPHTLAVLGCFLALIGLLAGVIAYLVPVLVEQISQLASAMTAVSDRLGWIQQHWQGWREQVALIPRFSEVSAWLTQQLKAYMTGLLTITGRFFAAFLSLFSVLFLAFFFLKDGGVLRDQVLSLIPFAQRHEAHGVLERISERVGRYVLGVLVNMAVVGLLTWIGLALLGVPYAMVLGLLVGILDVVPFLGPIIGALPGVLLAFSQDWRIGLGAIAIYWVVQQIEGYFTYPNVVGRATQLHPVWILLGILTGAQLLGVAGAVLAVPIMVVLQIILEEWYYPWVNSRRLMPRLRPLEPTEEPEALRFRRFGP